MRPLRTLMRRLAAAGTVRTMAAAENNLTPERMAAWKSAAARCERLRAAIFIARGEANELISDAPILL